MTLNELIEQARALGIDFDKIISVPYHDAVDVQSIEKSSFGGLLVRIF